MAGARPRSVTAVVCAAFDPATDAAILRTRAAVRAAGVALPAEPRHRPHITLAAARVAEGAELDRLAAVVDGVAADSAPIEVALDAVGRFRRSGVLWIAPARPSGELTELQRSADDALVAAGWARAFGERSAVRWVAHCTLATRIPATALRDVAATVAAGFAPIAARIDALSVILVGGAGDIVHHRLRARPVE